MLADAAGALRVPINQLRMETQEEDAAGCSGGPSASVQFEATRRIRSGPYQDGGRPISNPFPSFQQPRDGEILQQLEQICLNGDVDEQSSPERTRQPADIFEVSDLILPTLLKEVNC
jgi:hypothetical protein